MPESLFIKKETLAQLLSCEFCQISKNTFFTEHVWTTAFKDFHLDFHIRILELKTVWLFYGRLIAFQNYKVVKMNTRNCW